MHVRSIGPSTAAALLFSARLGVAQPPAAPVPPTSPALCKMCATWNAPQAPFRIHGNTYYVGPRGLSAILVTSSAGHVLIDGALPESAPLIAANIAALGFRLTDVKLILNSHVHFDHAGGIAELQRLSGAEVAASAPSRRVLVSGSPGRDDPQFGELLPFPKVTRVREIADQEVVRVGPLALTAHLTAGHSPGGTTWSWRACDGAQCVDVVYADSQSPIAAEGFRFSDSPTYPTVLQDFAQGHATLERLSCDILVTTHPEVSGLWERLAARESGSATALVDRGACARYAATAREWLRTRLERER